MGGRVDCLRERKSGDNMDDLMRAKDILGAVKRNKERIDPAEEDGGVITGYRIAHDQITEIIMRAIPTVQDVKPVVRSYWEKTPDGGYVCHECRNRPLLDGSEGDALSDYCPSCGARMEE